MARIRDSAMFVAMPQSATRMLDLPRPSPSPRFKRLGDVMMHVKVWQGGIEVRHRVMTDTHSRGSWTYEAIMNGATACDVPIASRYAAPIEAGLLGYELCRDGCFSPAELRKADDLRAKAEELHHAEAVKDEADRDAAYKLALERSRESVRRFGTGSDTEPVKKSEPDE